MEVIGGAYTIFILNGEDGTVQHSEDTPGSRVWPGIVVADVDGDSDLEIVTAQGGGYLNLLDHTGSVVWTRQPTGNELRGLSAYDLDDDGTLEIVVTGAVYNKTNTWVYEHDGTLRAGWPQLSNESGYAYGVFNDNAAIGDIDGDARPIGAASDVGADEYGVPVPAATAVSLAQLALADKAAPVISTSFIVTDHVYSAMGKRVPVEDIQAGGIVIVADFCGREATQSADDYRTQWSSFYLVGVEIDYERRSARLVPAGDRREFERMLAEMAAYGV